MMIVGRGLWGRGVGDGCDNDIGKSGGFSRFEDHVLFFVFVVAGAVRAFWSLRWRCCIPNGNG
jgi:hypothetical protein